MYFNAKSYFKSLFILLILSLPAYANIKDKISKSCPTQYNKYQNTISKYLFRIKDNIETIGCSVIPVYASIIESKNYELLDLIDDDSELLKRLINLYSANKEIQKVIFQNSTFKKMLLSNSTDYNFINNLTYLFSKRVYREDIHNIKHNITYLNYYLLSAKSAQSKDGALTLYNNLKKSISIELLQSFAIIYFALANSYSFNDLLENFQIIHQELTTDEINKLSKYPQYFVYFLYPSKKELGLETVSNYKLKQLQKDIEKKSLFLYKDIVNNYNNDANAPEVALKIVENIYYYIAKEHDIEYDTFVKFFHKLVYKGYLSALLEQDICSKESIGNFAVFSNNNIKNAILLFERDSDFANNLFEKLPINNKYSVFSLIFTANFYKKAESKEWEIFKKLFNSLPLNDYNKKIYVLKRLEELGYFSDIINEDDYKSIVKPDDDFYYPKYEYILTTSYPSKNDLPMLDQILQSSNDAILKDYLLKLMQMSPQELANHRFTTLDRALHYGDVVITGIEVVAFVATDGASAIAISGIKKVLKKKVIKYVAKKFLKNPIKTTKLLYKGYKFKKSIKFSNTLNSESKLIKNADNVSDSYTVIRFGLPLILTTSALTPKTICPKGE